MYQRVRYADLGAASTGIREAWLLQSARELFWAVRDVPPGYASAAHGASFDAVSAAFGRRPGSTADAARPPYPVDYRLWPEFEPALVHGDCWVASREGAGVAAGRHCVDPLVGALLSAGWVPVDDTVGPVTHIPHMRVPRYTPDGARRPWAHPGVGALMTRLLREGQVGCILCPPWAVGGLRRSYVAAERLVLLLGIGVAGRAALSDAHRVGGEGALMEAARAMFPSVLHLTRRAP